MSSVSNELIGLFSTVEKRNQGSSVERTIRVGDRQRGTTARVGGGFESSDDHYDKRGSVGLCCAKWCDLLELSLPR